MRTLIHWWRRRGMLPQTEKIDRLKELMKEEPPPDRLMVLWKRVLQLATGRASI